MRLSGSRADRRKADPIRADLKELLGNDFPKQRTEATRFVLAVSEALRRYVFSEALRQSEDDSHGVQQLDRVVKCAKQLLEFLQPHDSIQPYTWENEDGGRVERPALNWVLRVLDMVGRSKQGDSPFVLTATVRSSLQWLIDTSTDVQNSQRTDWKGVSKPKRRRGRPAGRRAAQVELALGLAISHLNVRIMPKLDKEYWKGPTGAYATLVKWALGRSPKRTKKGTDKGGDWAAVARAGLEKLRAVINSR